MYHITHCKNYQQHVCSEEQLEDLLQKVHAIVHKQCEDYFATNKDKIVKVGITARSSKCIYSLTSCIHLVDDSEIWADLCKRNSKVLPQMG